MTSPVIATDFGARGTGTVSLHSYSAVGGAFLSSGAPNVAGTYALDGGDSLVIGAGHGISTSILGPFYVPSTDPTFATITFTLDSGEFLAGDLLIVSNLSRQNTTTGALVLGSMFDDPMSGDPLIPRTGTDPYTSIGVWGTDVNGDSIYVAGGDPGVPNGYMYHSGGEVFRFNQNTSSVSFQLMLGDYGIEGEDGTGITPLALQATPYSFAFASPVPEPSGAMLVAFAAGILTLRRRRR